MTEKWDGKVPWIRLANLMTRPVLTRGHVHMSHEKKPGWLGFIGDYTIQLYGDYNKLFPKAPDPSYGNTRPS